MQDPSYGKPYTGFIPFKDLINDNTVNKLCRKCDKKILVNFMTDYLNSYGKYGDCDFETLFDNYDFCQEMNFSDEDTIYYLLTKIYHKLKSLYNYRTYTINNLTYYKLHCFGYNVTFYRIVGANLIDKIKIEHFC